MLQIVRVPARRDERPLNEKVFILYEADKGYSYHDVDNCQEQGYPPRLDVEISQLQSHLRDSRLHLAEKNRRQGKDKNNQPEVGVGNREMLISIQGKLKGLREEAQDHGHEPCQG